MDLRILTILVCLASATAVHAQPGEWSDARTFSTFHHRVLPIGGDRWAVMGLPTNGGVHQITAWNGTGDMEWEVVSNYWMGGGWGNVVLMPDSGLLHMGRLDGCDYMPNISMVTRYGPSGQAIWDTIFQSEFIPPPRLTAKGPTTMIALAGGDSTLLLDLDGAFIGSWASPDPDLMLMHWLSDTALFFLYNDAIRVHALDGSVLHSTLLDAEPRDVHFDGSQLLVLSDPGVRAFDADLQPAGTTLLPPNVEAWELHPTYNGVYVSTDAGLFAIVNGILEWSFTWPYPEAGPTRGATVRDSVVMTVGQWSVPGYHHGIVRALQADGTADQFDEDIEVLLDVDSVWSEFDWGAYWDRKALIRVRVVNHADIPVDRVIVSSRTTLPPGFGQCANEGLHEVITGLGLVPGDTTLVWEGVHEVRRGSIAWSGPSSEPVCAAVMAPNGLADRFPADNRVCLDLDFYLSLPEHGTQRLKIVPNPAMDRCLVTLPDGMGVDATFDLIDPAGRIARAGPLRDSAYGAAIIDLGGVPAGAYHLTVTGRHASASGRLIVLGQ